MMKYEYQRQYVTHPGYVVYNTPPAYIVGYMTVYLQYIQHSVVKMH